MKKILVIGVVIISIFLIYLTTIDKKVYYVSLGDEISLGITKEGYYEKSCKCKCWRKELFLR